MDMLTCLPRNTVQWNRCININTENSPGCLFTISTWLIIQFDRLFFNILLFLLIVAEQIFHDGREAANTHVIVFGLTRLGLEPTFYRHRDKHANHHITDVVWPMYRLNTRRLFDCWSLNTHWKLFHALQFNIIWTSYRNEREMKQQGQRIFDGKVWGFGKIRSISTHREGIPPFFTRGNDGTAYCIHHLKSSLSSL